MSETCTVIDAVGFENRPGEFLGDVVFLVGNSGRRQYGKAVRAVFSFYIAEFFGNQIECFIPGGFPMPAVFLRIPRVRGWAAVVFEE